tara:strand:+ start:511 stop:1014 length:504 start_codon:yes stop_codon:yes gene_type:complete
MCLTPKHYTTEVKLSHLKYLLKMNLKHIEQLTEYLDINHEKIVEQENEYIETMDHFKDIWEDTKEYIDEFTDTRYVGSDKILNKFISNQERNSNILSIKYELMKAEIERIYVEEMEVSLFTANDGTQYFLNEETNYLHDTDTGNIVAKYDDDNKFITYKLFSKVRGC